MNSIKQIFVIFFIVECFRLITPKPIFKGLSFKKNYEMEISAIPFKHISFIKEKWFPFKMIGVKHDIAKREVVEDPKDENLYSVNEVSVDNEENDDFSGLLTSVHHNLDLNSEGEIITKNGPVIENIQSVHVKPIIETENVATGIMHTSSIIPINPSIIIAPSIHATGTAVQPAAVVPLDPLNSKVEIQSVTPLEAVTPIQPMHTHIDVPSVEKLEESVSKMHTDISSAVPLNTLVASPAQEMDLPLPVDVKVEGAVVEPPKVVEEIKVHPVITSVVEQQPISPVAEMPAIAPAVEPPVLSPVLESPGTGIVANETPSKPGPVGLLMRGTRFVLYFGSVMLHLLSQMISGSPPSLNHVTEAIALT